MLDWCHVRKGEGKGCQHDGAGKCQPKRKTERSRCRVDAGGFTDAFFGNWR